MGGEKTCMVGGEQRGMSLDWGIRGARAVEGGQDRKERLRVDVYPERQSWCSDKGSMQTYMAPWRTQLENPVREAPYDPSVSR
jgi:hypothetical protein